MTYLLGAVRGFMALGLVLGLAGPAQAALVDQGSFDDGLGGMINLIYDDDLDITWLGDANLAGGAMNWQASKDWAAGLTVGGFTDWRLPTTTQPDTSCSIQDLGGVPGQGGGTGCTGSEMGHLFASSFLAVDPGEGITAVSPGPFSNVQALFYWSETGVAIGSSVAWAFQFGNGGQHALNDGPNAFAWAVRSGDVSAVPAPSAMC